MTDFQKKILTIIQSHFPITPRPYAVLAEQLASDEQTVYDAVGELCASGQIRRIGASINSRKVGYVSTLAALAVPAERVDEVAALINAYPGVTHNYQRENHYNLWFTLIAAELASLQNILQEIKGKTGLDDLLDLPATHMYKIKVDFNLTGKPARQEALAEAKPDPDPDSLSPAQSVPPLELNADDIAILRLLQDDISGSLEPFAQIAQELDEASVKLDEAAVIARTQALKASGMVRRFGAMVRHQKIGYAHNIMVAWLVPERGGLAERAGAIMAAQTGVSHCYQRPTAPTWPYNLYSMVHGKSEDDCLATVKDIDWALAAACVPHKPPALLRTVKEWKKTSMRYFL